MPEYKWTLKNKKYCTGCPMFALDFGLTKKEPDFITCAAKYYTGIQIKRDSHVSPLKKRPAACVRELGE